jgi:hypothetical protein
MSTLLRTGILARWVRPAPKTTLDVRPERLQQQNNLSKELIPVPFGGQLAQFRLFVTQDFFPCSPRRH